MSKKIFVLFHSIFLTWVHKRGSEMHFAKKDAAAGDVSCAGHNFRPIWLRMKVAYVGKCSKWRISYAPPPIQDLDTGMLQHLKKALLQCCLVLSSKWLQSLNYNTKPPWSWKLNEIFVQLWVSWNSLYFNYLTTLQWYRKWHGMQVTAQ